MKAPRLSSSDIRALRLGSAVLLPALVYGLAVKPYLRARSDFQDQMHAERALFARELDLLTRGESFAERLATSAAALEAESPRLFSAPDEMLALAELATYVEELARLSRVLVLGMESHGVEPVDGGVLALRLGVEAESDLGGVLRLLRRLEAGHRLIRVERVRIEAVRPRGASKPGDYEALRLSASVVGYMTSDSREAPAVASDPDASRQVTLKVRASSIGSTTSALHTPFASRAGPRTGESDR